MVEQMMDGCHGRIENHTRTRPSHHRAYFLPHFGLVAVRGTIFAGRLASAVSAMLQTRTGIFGQLPVLVGHITRTQFVSAIQRYHVSDYPLVVFYLIPRAAKVLTDCSNLHVLLSL
jgi:hypothetical protein